jgi:hypothetical protein
LGYGGGIENFEIVDLRERVIKFGLVEGELVEELGLIVSEKMKNGKRGQGKRWRKGLF